MAKTSPKYSIDFDIGVYRVLGMKPTPISILLPDLRGGGAEKINVSLAREFGARGYAVDFVLLRKTGELLQTIPSNNRVIDLNVKRIREAIRPLIAYLRSERPAAMLVNMWPLTSASVIARLLSGTGTRLVLCEHNALSVQYGDWGTRHQQLMRWSIQTLYPQAYARVAVSEGVADELARVGHLDRKSVRVIYNPIPLPNSDGCVEVVDWGVPPGRRILSVGSLKSQKNQLLLLDAFAQMEGSDSARLVILGEGPMRRALEERCMELAISDRVLMPGFVADPSSYYRSADVFALSSNHEGLPTVLIEALGWGLPVVSTDCPHGPSEILEGGRFGRLVPVRDPVALARAMEEELLSPHDSEMLRSRAADFVPSRAADRYLELLLGACD